MADKIKQPKKRPLRLKAETEELPSEVKQLQEELRMARLHIRLLEATIDIADEQLGTDIRKKSGTRPS